MSEQSERNKALVLEYMAAFRTFDPDVYFPYLAEEPLYMAGMNIRRGRDAFKANTDAGRILYPEPESATNEHLAVVAEGDWVAVLLKRRARTSVEDYENLYGMFYVATASPHGSASWTFGGAGQFDLSALRPPS